MAEFRCKHCGSLNLELEEKGNQTGLYCCDCGKWLKWVTKEEKRVFNNKNTCTPIYAPNGATNGERLKKYQTTEKALDVACELMVGAILYGVDKDELWRRVMEAEEVVSSGIIKEFILNNIDRFSPDSEEELNKAIKRLGW